MIETTAFAPKTFVPEIIKLQIDELTALKNNLKTKLDMAITNLETAEKYKCTVEREYKTVLGIVARLDDYVNNTNMF